MELSPQQQITALSRAMDLIEDAQDILEAAGIVAESARLDPIVAELEHEADYLAATEYPEVEPRQTVGINHHF